MRKVGERDGAWRDALALIDTVEWLARGGRSKQRPYVQNTHGVNVKRWRGLSMRKVGRETDDGVTLWRLSALIGAFEWLARGGRSKQRPYGRSHLQRRANCRNEQ